MKTMKRCASILLAAVLFVGLLTPAKANAAISTSTFATKVQEFISDSRWKNGIAWADAQKPKLSTWSSTGCCAYAADFAAYVYGSTSAAWTSSAFTKFTNLNEIRTGDIIHTSNHWFVVLERNGDTFRTAEGNFDDKTRVCSDGWGIKNGKIYNLKASSGERTFEYGYHYNFSDTSTTTYSSSQIYYNINMSSAVLASRTNQQVSGDCAVVSMATVEAYMYGATTASEKKTVYNALVSKNGDNDYAYWSNCGYVSHSSINWTTVYDNLAKGYPVIVHRPASGSKVQHWAVVAGYKGSTTTLEKDKFIIVDVYHGSGGTDYYTSGDWRGSVSIDRMVTRKNGINITSLPGIRMAINHPASAHQYGKGHGVYGYVTSNANLTSVQVKVTNASTGAAVYNKTLTPNAKSYLIYNLDSDMTFAKWAKGKYIYTVVAKTASSSRTYQRYFEIASGWPLSELQQKYVFTFNANGGSGAPASQTVYFNGTLHIPVTTPTRSGYTFKGWYAKRNADQAWFSQGNGWYTEAQLTAAGYTKRLYSVNADFVINNSWLAGCMETTGFTLYAVWSANEVATYNVKYNANGGSGAPASQTKTAGTALKLSSTKPTRDGYTFKGWATSATGSVAYQPGGSYTTDAAVTLYAVWEKNAVTSEPKIVLTSKTAAAGGKVTLDLMLENNPGFCVLDIAFDYDTKYLSLISVENKVSALTMLHDGGVLWDATDDYTNDGTLATLTFEIANNAPAGDYEIKAIFMDASNSDLEAVTMSSGSGSISVTSTVYGDVNGDGKISAVDLAMLRKYIAGRNPITGESSLAVKAGADCNGDGSIGAVDLAMLRKYLACRDPFTGISSVVMGPK